MGFLFFFSVCFLLVAGIRLSGLLLAYFPSLETLSRRSLRPFLPPLHVGRAGLSMGGSVFSLLIKRSAKQLSLFPSLAWKLV